MLIHPKLSSQNLIISSQVSAPNPYYFPPNSTPKPYLFHPKHQPPTPPDVTPQGCSRITPPALFLNIIPLSSQRHPPASTQQCHPPNITTVSTLSVTPTLSYPNALTPASVIHVKSQWYSNITPMVSPQCYLLMSTLLISQHHFTATTVSLPPVSLSEMLDNSIKWEAESP